MRLIECLSMRIMDCLLAWKGLAVCVVVPIFSIIFWFIPYQKYSYIAVANDQAWTFWFPNIRKVLLQPFPDPEKVSGMLVAMDVFFVVWILLIAIAFMPRFIRLNKSASKVIYISLKDVIGQLIGVPLFFVSGFIILFIYDGSGFAASNHYALPSGFLFALGLGLTWWLVTMTYLVFVRLLCGYVKIKKFEKEI